MLDILDRVITVLPLLLKEDISSWQSLHIAYHPPVVDRLYRSFENRYRIYLHRIHKCSVEESYIHTHPWKSAIYIVRGVCGMDLFYGAGDKPEAKVSSLELAAGSKYQMNHPDGWHAVYPITVNTMSVMVTDEPWEYQWRGFPAEDKPNYPMEKLPLESANDLLNSFRAQFTAR